mmetsp:Transcript_73930/g.228444  ORF Transcript_73930/g.228444 Transcript_73930/m.228444 type:complete len:87 (-) Transcript_73930:1073-1333(-)
MQWPPAHRDEMRLTSRKDKALKYRQEDEPGPPGEQTDHHGRRGPASRCKESSPAESSTSPRGWNLKDRLRQVVRGALLSCTRVTAV